MTSDLIGNEPRTTPLQLRAAIALSACRNKMDKQKLNLDFIHKV